MELKGFDSEAFLRDHWQKQPLLIRNPWASWRNPLDPDELAGLACQPEIESRLIVQAGDTWSLEHGPIPEARFGGLGDAPWTLLVQAVDHHVPEVAALIEPFRFIPNWRVDDVMVSYAVDRGGVGPHFDQYDVFLVQGLGRRRWQLGAVCGEDAGLLPLEDLRLLERFEAIEEWVLEPGDILYLPPRVAHNGLAVGDDCMTYSIGFRAPSRRDLVAAWCDEVLPDLSDDDRYADPGLARQDNPGEIAAPALARLHAMVTEQLLDRDAFARWFGRYASTPRYPDVDWAPEDPVTIEDLRATIVDAPTLQRNAASRFSYIAQTADRTLLFVDGRCFECSDDTAAFARALCAEDRVQTDPRSSDATLALICELYNHGSIAFEAED
jgi:50S ribosomal protein L16 3-hydroxylase